MEGAEGIGDEYAQKIGSNGKWGDCYWYLTEEAGCEAGWYKDAVGDIPVTDADVVKLGEGLSFSCGADVTISYSGKVYVGAPSFDVAAGKAMIGNPTPGVKTKISQIEVAGAEGIGDEYAQRINSNGKWGDCYWYLTEEAGCETGWYKDAVGDIPVTDADELNIGEAVSFSTGSDVKVTFPAVIRAQ